MKVIFIVIAMTTFLAGCTAPNYSKDALEKAGFSNIEIGGYDFFACSKGDTFATEFTATNPLGKRVSGTVCCGIFKSCTIRF